jgi:glycosyltransferase involved in cell wall biosynthesis
MSINDIGTSVRVTVAEPGQHPKPLSVQAARPILDDVPLITCMMPTRGHLFPARFAIDSFLRQTYPNREMVVVCQSAGSEVETYLKALGDPRFRFFQALSAKNVGEMRNVAVAEAKGRLICTWDDDDLYPATRLATQYTALVRARAQASFLLRMILWSPAMARMGISATRFWENSMLAEKALIPEYESRARAEDTIAVDHILANARTVAIDNPRQLCYVRHGRNISHPQHFPHLYSQATARFENDAYYDAISDLSPIMPLAEYALRFFEDRRRTGVRNRAAAKPEGAPPRRPAEAEVEA